MSRRAANAVAMTVLSVGAAYACVPADEAIHLTTGAGAAGSSTTTTGTGGTDGGLKENGAACAMDDECASTHCADHHVCCDTECTGICMACEALAKGTGEDGTCGDAKAGLLCGPACSAGMFASGGTCDGAGNCSVTPTSCAPYACNGSGCLSSCTQDSDCSGGPCNICPPSAAQACLAPLTARQTNTCQVPFPTCAAMAPSTCGPIARFDVGMTPTGIAFDGMSIWVANHGDLTVSKQSANSATFTLYPVGFNPAAIAFDGASIWVAGKLSTGTTGGRLSKLDLDGSPATGTWPVALGASSDPAGLAFDGTHMWMADSNGTVTVLGPDGSAFASTGSNGVGTGLSSIAFDGTNMWVASESGGYVKELSLAGTTLSVTATVTLDPSVGAQPWGIASDGTNMWVTGGVPTARSTRSRCRATR